MLGRRRHSRVLSRDDARDVATFLDDLGIDSILFVPVGAGHECLGNLVLSRDASAPDWTDDEAAAALEMGRDLGVAIHSVRAYERERRLVQELETLQARLNRLVAGADRVGDTITHEPAADTGVARTRDALRAAGDALEQTGRRRDAQARIVADALAHGQPARIGAVETYRNLTDDYRAAHRAWQLAFDAWQDLSGGTST